MKASRPAGTSFASSQVVPSVTIFLPIVILFIGLIQSSAILL